MEQRWKDEIKTEMDRVIKYYALQDHPQVLTYEDFVVCWLKNGNGYLVLTKRNYDKLSKKYLKLIQHDYVVGYGNVYGF